MMSTFPKFAPEDLREAYLDLLKRSLMGWPYSSLGYKTTEVERLEGKDWPDHAMTLLSLTRLNNIHTCIESVLRDNIPGDLMECGVWRGGACILMLGVLHAWGIKDRAVHLVDSFAGVPEPTVESDKNETFHNYGYLAVGRPKVHKNIERYGLYSKQVRFLEGWFNQTLPEYKNDRPLAVLRIDADLYESTVDCLHYLYPQLSIGGYVIIDDYVNFPHVRKAVDEYRAQNNIKAEVIGVDWSAVYWRKS